MHNKLIILSFCLLAFVSVNAQEVSDESGRTLFSTTFQENKVDIYPNPVVENLTVQITNPTLENIEFELHSIIGNQMTIRVQNIGLGKYKISVEAFATGYYFLVIKDEDARFKKAYKFLKD